MDAIESNHEEGQGTVWPFLRKALTNLIGRLSMPWRPILSVSI